jgi:dTDP-4-dehydrorhamnose reductase
MPVNIYGNNKSRAEDYISRNLIKHMIVRTSSVFSSHGHNFVKTMYFLQEKLSNISVVSDQISCPTSATSLASFIKKVCSIYKQEERIQYGTYHFCNHPEISWADFADKIFEIDSKISNEVKPNIIKTSFDSYSSNLKRPKYTVLDTSKTLATFDIKSQSWEEELELVLRDLRNAS